MARRDKPEENEPAAEPEAAPAAPVSHVLVGAAAHDPLAHREQAGPSLLTAATWAAAKKLRAVDIAGFLMWTKANAPDLLSADEWATTLATFQQTPIK
jgi:hypothetical protein